ncbi:hypothetical protein ABW21_db0204004 [Orbilia brochopaga]|nr:hypothetical protein ABW21_db0204004 [Drechslerella brochopaga]
MSEYWVSLKRYWCERCKLFVKDSPLSRKDHEASPRHQHALQRFLRELQKSKEREVVAAENTKREAERLNNLDNPDYVPKPLARRAADIKAKPATPAKSSTYRSEEQQQKHLDELAALGVAMPETYRKEHAMAGEWETVRVIERPATPEDAGSDDESEQKRIKRRKLGDAGEEEQEDEEDAASRNFTVRTMEYPPGDTSVSGSIGGITFKKKGSSKHAMRTMEYPNQPSAPALGNIVFKKKGAKTEEKAEEEGPPIDRQAGESLKQSDNEEEEPSDRNPTPANPDDNPVSKHESDEEDKPVPAPPAVEAVEEGASVAFKVRKSRNTNRRRI